MEQPYSSIDNMRVSVAQLMCACGEPKRNQEKFISFSELAAKHGSELIVFPEMADTGYDLNLAVNTAEIWGGTTYSLLRDLAQRLSIIIVSGIAEREGDRVYNAVVAFDKNGMEIGHYRKIHLFTGGPIHEQRVISPGSEIIQIKINNFGASVFVCYDIRFPEV